MPRIKTTRTVNIALFVLRIYLIGMLLLILGKFVIDARKAPPKPQDTTRQQSRERYRLPGLISGHPADSTTV